VRIKLVLSVLICVLAQVPARASDVLLIPATPATAEVKINVATGWIVRAHCSHDRREMTCRFDNLKKAGAERFPELMIDPQDAETSGWQKGQWWLHSSYNLCEGNGEFNVYERDGVFQCSREKPGWKANHFPLKEGEAMVIRITLAKLGLAPGRRFGLAFDVTDTQSHWSFWPINTTLTSPATWAQAELSP
jgi:hypothetical protein